jgi:hypothetical protein
LKKIFATVALGAWLLVGGSVLTPPSLVQKAPIAALIGATPAEACPKGQITCGRWCELHRPNQASTGWRECKFTHAKSCANLHAEGVNHCVGRNQAPR